ncbi:MAG: DNA polymerase IV, partial [Deltaproteobacteria bacterium]|nr:DNA polymerase IV [Deltaproteobacteria bacterium]
KVADLRSFSLEELTKIFGSLGERLLEAAWGRDSSPVEPRGRPKSISAEQTLAVDTASLEELIPLLAGQALKVGRRLRRRGLKARTVTLKLKHSDFKQITRSHSLERPIDSSRAIFQAGLKLLRSYGLKVSVRLIGLGLSNLEGPGQAELFPSEDSGPDRAELDRALDQIMTRYGSQAIKLGVSVKKD